MVVTTAVKLPAVGGLFVENEIVREVAVAAVTVPTELPLKTTLLFATIGSKPKPLIVNVDTLADRFAVLLVIDGATEAT